MKVITLCIALPLLLQSYYSLGSHNVFFLTLHPYDPWARVTDKSYFVILILLTALKLVKA